MKRKLLWILPVMCAALLLALPALADQADVSFDLVYEYGMARAVFELTNEFRTGADAWYWNNDNTTTTDLTGTLSELTYDYGLERAAMQRAAEIAVYFDHTRPDGSSCFSVHANIYGENIAAGYGSAASVVKGWREDDYKYSGQGHRRNMLGKGYTTIGVGCVRAGGMLYWVQEFGCSATGESASSLSGPVMITVDPDVLGSSNIGDVYADPSDILLQKDGKADLPRVIACLGWGRTPVTVEGVVWEAADPSVANVYDTEIIAYALGTTEVSAIVFDKIVTVPVTVLTWPSAVTAPGGILDLSTLEGFDVSKASDWTGAAVQGGFLVADRGGRVTYKYAFSGDKVLDLYFDVTVTAADIANLCTADIGDGQFVYTGEEIKAPVTVTLPLGGADMTLTEGTHYTLGYADNINVGTAAVTVTGMGNFTGEIKLTFTIKPLKISAAKLSYTSKVYTGTALKPEPTVTAKTDAGTLTLKKTRDYTVTYQNNKSVGKATVTIKGVGNFTGTLKKTFTIKAVTVKANGVSLAKKSVPYTGKAIEPAVTVKATVNGKTVTLKKGTNYTVTYKNNVNAGTATVTVKCKGNFTGTVKKTFKITRVGLVSAKLEYTKADWTGNALKPGVTVKAKVNGKTVTLKAGRDYTVTYKNNVNKGKASVTIKGKGNFTGTLNKTFKIK